MADLSRPIAAVGAGDFALPTADVSPEKHVRRRKVRDKVNRVLSDPSFKENAKRTGESYGGAPYAARLIEWSV